MPSRSWQFRIDDIVEAINKIERYTHGIDFASWQNDEKTVDAVIRNLEVIGEASSQSAHRSPRTIRGCALGHDEGNS